VVAERVSRLKADYDKQIKDFTTHTTLTTQRETLLVDNSLSAASKAGVEPTALEDILRRGREIFASMGPQL
jgi:hypothetical protein